MSAPLRSASRALGLVVLLGAVSAGEAILAQDEGPLLEVGLGVSGRLAEVVLPGPELQVVALDRDAPFVLRITAASPHGTAHRYDFEFYGLEAGDYDLTELLTPVQDEPQPDLPALRVRVVDGLPFGQVEPRALEPGELPSLGGYRLTLVAGGVAWAVGLLALLWAGKRRRQAAVAASDPPPPTLAARLRPLIEEARGGRLAPEGQASLERLLLSAWRRRLKLEDLPPGQALARLRDDPTAGDLLRQLEAWLHQPPGRAPETDVDALLAPYADLSDDEAFA